MYKVGFKRRCALVSPLLALTILSGCAHDLVPGPGMTSYDLSRVQGQCRYAARHGGGGFAAFGNAKVVLAAGVGYAIGSAIRTGQDYNDCMRALGAVDQTDAPPTATASSTPVLREPLAPPGAPIIAVSSYSHPQPVPLSISNDPSYFPTIYQTGLGLDASRSVDVAASWLQANDVLNRNDAQSRGLYAALCKAGDKTSCVMAASFRTR